MCASTQLTVSDTRSVGRWVMQQTQTHIFTVVVSHEKIRFSFKYFCKHPLNLMGTGQTISIKARHLVSEEITGPTFIRGVMVLQIPHGECLFHISGFCWVKVFNA